MRILFVGTAWSPHLARWVGQLGGQGWDIHLFPLNADEGVHPDLRDLTVHDAIHGRPPGAHRSVRAVDDFWPFVRDGYPFSRGAMTARRVERGFFPKRADRAWRLAHAVRNLRPDIVHSMTLWPAGDLVMQARAHLGGRFAFPPWIASAWGTDIYLFPRLAEYGGKIRAVLAACDYFTCDCRRDTATATALGFRGELLPVLPVTGGLDVARTRRLRPAARPSRRRLVLLKGVNRALFGLRALELCRPLLDDYTVGIYSADPDVRVAAELLAASGALRIEIVPPSSPDDMLRLHGRARVSLGVSRSDGLPLSALEAMAMGSFPVQTDTSCINEWVRHEVSCLLVHPEDPEGIAAALRRALTDDELVDRAAEINWAVVEGNFDSAAIRPRIIGMYEQAARARGSAPGA